MSSIIILIPLINELVEYGASLSNMKSINLVNISSLYLIIIIIITVTIIKK